MDTEVLAMEEEAETAWGAGEISKMWTAMARVPQGSGAGPLPGGTAAGKSNTREVTSAGADEAGEGVRHGARPGVRERVAGRWENLSGESSDVGDREGGHEASGVAENPEGDRQGVGGGVKSPQGIEKPGVEEFPQGEIPPK